MKRILLFAAVLLVAATASAQVKITRNEHPVKQVAELTMVSSLMQRDSLYFLMFVTDNRYDDAVLISLGDGIEEALASLDGLEEMLAGIAQGETFYIEDMEGEEYLVSRIGKTKYARLTSSRRAGSATLHPVAVTRARKALTATPSAAGR